MDGQLIARAGALLGLLMSILLTFWIASTVGSDGDDTGLLWGVPLKFAYIAPFLLSALVSFQRGLRHQGTPLLGAGVAAVLLAFSSFAGVTLPLLIPAALLIIGGVLQLQFETPWIPIRTYTFVLAPMGATILSFPATWFAPGSVSWFFLFPAIGLWVFLAVWVWSLAHYQREEGGAA